MYKLFIITIGMLFFTKMAFTQQDLTLYYMDRIAQVNSTNPGFMPESKLNIGLPVLSSLYFSASNSGFSYNSLVDIDRTIKNMANLNFLSFNNKIDLLSTGFKIKKNYFSLTVTENIMERITYPRDLLLIVWEGNGESFLGKRADMNGLGFDFLHYREYNLGYARKLMDDKLTIGAKFKYLSGFQNFRTKRSVLGLHTDEENYALTIDGAVELNSSGIEDISTGNFDFSKMAISAGNHGFGFDLGTNFEISEKISVSAALLDVGYIKWQNNVKNLKLDDFSFTFSGLDMGTMITPNDTSQSSFQTMTDSLKNLFTISDNTESYETWLGSRLMMGGLYKFHKNHSVGALIHGEIVKGSFNPAITFSVNTKVQRWLSATLAYSYYNRSFKNLGFGLSLNAGPVQYFVVTDNVLAPFFPYSAKNAHLRFGLNLHFGRPGKANDN